MKATVVAACIALVALLAGAPRADGPAAAPSIARTQGQRHHYTIGARIRPLLFWIGKDDVGDAVLAKKHDGDAIGYSLLIGSDPERAPRHINRWGYLSEEVRGDEATLVGLMTESDEESVSQAEANLQKQAGERTFNVIRASVTQGESRSVVTSVAASSDYTFRHVDTLLDLAERKGTDGRTRVVRLPDGTRPGFLVALGDVIHRQVRQWTLTQGLSIGPPITYVYHGKLYQLRTTRSHAVANVHVGDRTYEHAIATQFQIRSLRDGEQTDFSMTYAADGPLAETPLIATYQPRWWIEIQLTLDDSKVGPALASETMP